MLPAAIPALPRRARWSESTSQDGRPSWIVSFRLQQQNRHSDAVLHATGCGAKKDVRQKSVSVSAHRDQIASLLLDPLDDLFRRFAVRQFGLSWNIHGLELGSDFFQVCSVFQDLRADGVGT